jgi:membrane protein
MQFRLLARKTAFLLKETVYEFFYDNGLTLSAALSYYTIFALAPLLIIIISIFGFIFGTEAIQGEIFGQINGLVGSEAALQIQEIIKNVKLSKNNFFVTVISAVILLIMASGVFTEIQDSLNYIWGIEAKPKRGFIKFIKNRLMSISMIASVGFLLMVGLIINSLADLLIGRLTQVFIQNTVYLLYAGNLLVVFISSTLLFTVIFKVLPDGEVALMDCIIGASFTAVLFMFGKFLIGAYLARTVIVSVYGAAGSIIVILIWVYYSAIILFFGAEFTKVYAHTHGEKIIPNEYSVRVKKQIIEHNVRDKLKNK